MHASVVYGLPDQQVVVRLELPAGATVGEAVERSGLAQRFPEIGAQACVCAVYGRAVPLNHALSPGDRVEILRPLQIDPKESRRQAAARARRKV